MYVIKERGFTLIELMIAVAIVAIIAAIAYPSYLDQVKSTRRGDAQGALMSFSNAMERYYTQQGSYLGADGAAPPAPITTTLTVPAASLFPSEAPLDGNPKSYDLRIYDLKANSYVLRAVPKGPQAGDGVLELSSTGARGWDADNVGGITASEQNWN